MKLMHTTGKYTSISTYWMRPVYMRSYVVPNSAIALPAPAAAGEHIKQCDLHHVIFFSFFSLFSPPVFFISQIFPIQLCVWSRYTIFTNNGGEAIYSSSGSWHASMTDIVVLLVVLLHTTYMSGSKHEFRETAEKKATHRRIGSIWTFGCSIGEMRRSLALGQSHVLLQRCRVNIQFENTGIIYRFGWDYHRWSRQTKGHFSVCIYS